MVYPRIFVRGPYPSMGFQPPRISVVVSRCLLAGNGRLRYKTDIVLQLQHERTTGTVDVHGNDPHHTQDSRPVLCGSIRCRIKCTVCGHDKCHLLKHYPYDHPREFPPGSFPRDRWLALQPLASPKSSGTFRTIAGEWPPRPLLPLCTSLPLASVVVPPIHAML
jgi:hypothetical protein